MIGAVLDTNVLASEIAGSGRPDSATAILVSAWRAQRYTLLTSNTFLSELRCTLSNPYFSSHIAVDQVARALVQVRERSDSVALTVRVRGIATHPEDDLILATAVNGQADYLVTGDRAL